MAQAGRKGVLAMSAGAGVVVALLIVVLLATRDHKETPKDPNPPISIANSFPVPAGSAQSFPDSVTPKTATKFWKAQGAGIDRACSAWRDAYRAWIEQGAVGSVSGDDEPGRRCTLSGPKLGHTVDLSVTVYGEDTTPQITLTVRGK